MGNERETASNAPTWMEAAQTKIDEATHSESEQACTTTADDPCARAKTVITASFGSMQHFAMIELGKLKTDLTKADKPSWTEQLLEGLLEISLKVGGEGVGAYLAERLLSHEAEVLGSLMKKVCEEAAPAGVDMASAALGGRASPDPEEFIAAQQTGIVAMYQAAQTAFIESGQDAIATTKDARGIKKALDPSHLADAARFHYIASRDQYLSCLAQQTLGTTDDGTRTNMSPGSHKNGHAPDYATAAIGIDRGVLEADVMMYDDVKREPGVWRALLNGVNDTIREQYEHVTLASVNIPRQLVCSVRGDMPDFTVNVDESGAMQLVRGSGEWLEARARAERPDAAHLSKQAQQRIGLDLLLHDLEIDELGHGGKS